MTLTPIGFGTERVEEELVGLFADARIARIDTDTASDRRLFLQTLKQMRDGEIDILIGTQMIAKGHHFPNVTLVGVLWADGGLSMPDYRAAEKTFQLITQVTGRAGRGDEPGEVYIQTYRPEHYAIQYARAHQYEQMVQRELDLRRNPLFPPYVRLVAIHIQGEQEEKVKKCAETVAVCCRSMAVERKQNLEILGPAPAPIERLRSKYRWQVLLKSTEMEALHAICRRVQADRQEFSGSTCTIAIDVDPENMM
jgi:primosomal protein N' (replication factor Y) (superfamily II helicase)